MRWIGTELTPSPNHSQKRFRSMNCRFLTLKVPISSQVLFICRISTSFLVGAVRHCMQKLLAPSNKVPMQLMTMCTPRPVLRISSHGPTWSVPIPPLIGDERLAHIVVAAFKMRTPATRNNADLIPNGHSLFEGMLLSVESDDRAVNCGGNHGENPSFSDERSALVLGGPGSRCAPRTKEDVSDRGSSGITLSREISKTSVYRAFPALRLTQARLDHPEGRWRGKSRRRTPWDKMPSSNRGYCLSSKSNLASEKGTMNRL